MPPVHKCGRCGTAVAPFGFGPGFGKSGPRVWACADHRADAERWWRGKYHKPIRTESDA